MMMKRTRKGFHQQKVSSLPWTHRFLGSCGSGSGSGVCTVWLTAVLLLSLFPLAQTQSSTRRNSAVKHKHNHHNEHDNDKTFIPTFEINLDLPPEDRWTHVIQHFQEPLLKIRDWVVAKHFSGAAGQRLIQMATLVVEHVFPRDPDIRRELSGVARALNHTSTGLILLLNLYYDLQAACTSIVATTPANGAVWHGRNLDFDIPNLQAITLNVNFTKDNGELLYQGTTYAAYIGVPTGMKPGVFSISQDARTPGDSPWDNLAEWIFKGGRAYSLLYREILERAETYEKALQMMQETPLISPSYFIIAGAKAGQGAVVSRARDSTVDVWRLDNVTNNTSNPRWFLVQTNDDHWQPPDDDRRDAANHNMELYCGGSANVTARCMKEVMNQRPTLNQLTTYTTVMSAGANHFESQKQNVQQRPPPREKELNGALPWRIVEQQYHYGRSKE